MTWVLTCGLAGSAVLATGVCGWLGARPAKPFAPPRLVPWRFLMLLSFTVLIAALVHMVALVRTI